MVKFSKLMALFGSKMLVDALHQASIRKGRRELTAKISLTIACRQPLTPRSGPNPTPPPPPCHGRKEEPFSSQLSRFLSVFL